MQTDITLCITMGRRPELLRRTLESLNQWCTFEKVIAINDFRDDATNQVFLEVFPNSELISLTEQLGHHGAVDYMYAKVETPYVFHCEDDWLFDAPFNFEAMKDLLSTNKSVSQICFRKMSDFSADDVDPEKVVEVVSPQMSYLRLDHLHKQWHGYTFNPHLVSRQLWAELGGFGSFKKERHISRAVRAQGRYVAYLNPGNCSHLGDAQSVSLHVTKPTGLRKLRKQIKKFFLG
jgi:glycosyltransferase involved in cell wall biosynthesis